MSETEHPDDLRSHIAPSKVVKKHTTEDHAEERTGNGRHDDEEYAHPGDGVVTQRPA